MTIALDTASAERIVNNERSMYVHEVDGMQREKKVLLHGQPYNNAILLSANMLQAALFFYVTSLNASSVLPPDVAWAQPLVGGVCAIAAGCLMYGTNAIAYKLPTIEDTATKWMMWPAWITMLIISAVVSAFLTLLLVNGADSQTDTARMSMAQAERVAGVETAAVVTATKQLDTWIDNGSDARTLRTEAVARRDKAQTLLTDWRADTLAEWGQGSEAANRRMNAAHPEHAPLIAAVNRAQADVTRAQADVDLSDTRVEEWTGKLAAAERTQRAALTESKESAVSNESPWEETMDDMASMMEFFGLHFTGGDQFKASFAILFALTMTLAPPFWSYQTGASVAPEVKKQSDRMTSIDERAKEMRQGGGSSVGGASAGVVPGVAPASDAPRSETESMGTIVDLAFGLASENPTLPCGLKQADYEKYYRSNFDKVQRVLDDAENRMIAHTGEIALKQKYRVGPNVAKMLKHVLVLENFGEYSPDGSVTLFNPAEG